LLLSSSYQFGLVPGGGVCFRLISSRSSTARAAYRFVVGGSMCPLPLSIAVVVADVSLGFDLAFCFFRLLIHCSVEWTGLSNDVADIALMVAGDKEASWDPLWWD
jgi:hypothetical protein